MTELPETVLRPTGRHWQYHERTGRGVRVEQSPEGPVLVICRTHEPERAARMASVRWPAFYPGVPLPTGSLEWRRIDLGNKDRRPGQDFFDAQPRLVDSDGRERRSFPVTVFRPPPALAEGAA